MPGEAGDGLYVKEEEAESFSMQKEGKAHSKWRGLLRAMGYGLAAALVTLGAATIISRVSGQASLGDRIDRNAQVSVTGHGGIRCFLNAISDTPEVPVTKAEVDACFADFDRLTRRYNLHQYDAGPGVDATK